MKNAITITAIAALTAASGFANADIVRPQANTMTFDDMSNGTAMRGFSLGGVDVTIRTPNARLEVYSYNSDIKVFRGDDSTINSANSPKMVSQDMFISGANRNGGPMQLSDLGGSITFEMSEGVSLFSLVTLDLLEWKTSETSYLAVTAYDAQGNIVDEHRRFGPQGPTGVTLFWEVESLFADITRVVISTNMTKDEGLGFGIDNISLSTAERAVPTPGAAAILALGGLTAAKRRRRALNG